MTQSGPLSPYSISFSATFELLEDPRRLNKGNIKYPIAEILFLVISSVICGFSDYTTMEDFGNQNLNWLQKFYPYKNGICSHDTIGKLFQKIDYALFNICFMQWSRGMYEITDNELIAIDGKRVCNSYDTYTQMAASHIVSAFMASNSICLGQVATMEKSNEITAIPLLLDSIDCTGAVVSIDAMGCQRDITAKIIDKNANYLIAVKENQKELYTQIEHLFKLNLPCTTSTTEDSDHGRIEKRTATLITDISLLDEKDKWKELNSILKIDTERYDKLKKTTSYHTRYYISSCKSYTVLKMNTFVREHWSIENKLHWQLDVNFGEDDARKRMGDSAKNFNLILKTGLALLQRDKTTKLSIKRKKLKATFDLKYRESLLKV